MLPQTAHTTMTSEEYRNSTTKEKHIQDLACQWMDVQGIVYHPNTNGQYRPGQSMEKGIQKGIPDLFIAEPAGPWHGLYVELKKPGKYPRKKQREWLERLKQQGYATFVCRSFDTFQRKVNRYLRGDLPEREQWPTVR